ncbi:MAG: BrnA antitoxin family protein [Deltaproteobacteria bacterium]|nr:BrnA antitoxin family protein [Deltaproteobacteria bacterium]
MKKEYDLKRMKVKRRGAVLSKKAKVLKTIRLDAEVLTWLNAEAEKRGIGYQTLLNMLLRERMSSSPRALRDEIRDIVREEMQRAG